MSTVLVKSKRSAQAGNYLTRNVSLSIARKISRPRIQADPKLVIAARRFWMTRSGLPPQEIDEFCDLDEYPGTLEDELDQIAALGDIDSLCQRMKWNR